MTPHGTVFGDPHTDDPRVERTRAAVIKAAAELLMAGGPDAVTHARVAAEANVSRTTVYKHWPTRPDLLRSTIEELGKSVPSPANLIGDLRTDLGYLLGGLAEHLRDEPHARLIGMMMARAPSDDAVAAVRDEMVDDVERIFDEVIATAVAGNELRDDLDSELALASIVGSLLFIRFMAGSTIDDHTVSRVIDEFVESNAPR